MAQVRVEAIVRQAIYKPDVFEKAKRRVERVFALKRNRGGLSLKWGLIDLLGGRSGRIESGTLTGFYDAQYGEYSKASDALRRESENVLEQNPQLRRLDVVAEKLFEGGTFKVLGVKSVMQKTGAPARRRETLEGITAGIRVESEDRMVAGVLTLDLKGEEVKFTKLEVVDGKNGKAFLVRLSLPTGGVVVEEFSSVFELQDCKSERETANTPLSIKDESKRKWPYTKINDVVGMLARRIYGVQKREFEL
ncbi:hypothetical protein HY992_00550 [Candidatus Micrarchaeota archaeon]|nr:hypothetical protein [Candidatus Micrarchaeota archaeon]